MQSSWNTESRVGSIIAPDSIRIVQILTCYVTVMFVVPDITFINNIISICIFDIYTDNTSITNHLVHPWNWKNPPSAGAASSKKRNGTKKAAYEPKCHCYATFPPGKMSGNSSTVADAGCNWAIETHVKHDCCISSTYFLQSTTCAHKQSRAQVVKLTWVLCFSILKAQKLR